MRLWQAIIFLVVLLSFVQVSSASVQVVVLPKDPKEYEDDEYIFYWFLIVLAYLIISIVAIIRMLGDAGWI